MIKSYDDNAVSWIMEDEYDKEYYLGQYKKVYRSTEVFVENIDEFISKSNKILDMACGAGSNTIYLAQKYKNIDFVGVDINSKNIEIGLSKINELKVDNCQFKYGNWYQPNSDDINVFDGIISFQTLSWLSGYKREIECLAKLNPNWIAMSSLFFEGEIDFDIKISEYDRKDKNGIRKSYYNIYSIPKVREEFSKHGYDKFKYIKFDIDIPQTKPGHMGTYTKKMENGERLQISGPLLMPWYFIIAYK